MILLTIYKLTNNNIWVKYEDINFNLDLDKTIKKSINH